MCWRKFGSRLGEGSEGSRSLEKMIGNLGVRVRERESFEIY